MSVRPGIRKHLIKAWKRCIERDYCSQAINSERSLQASFSSYLRGQLEDTRRLFIEPTMMVNQSGDEKPVRPDIVVCNRDVIIAIVELKYAPRGGAHYNKDLDTLATIARARKEKKGIELANERYLGKVKEPKKYPLSPEILFVWAGVHFQKKKDRETPYHDLHPDKKVSKSLKGCFLELHAETKEGDDPEIYPLE